MLFPVPAPHTDPHGWPELLVYAATVYLEAEGEPHEGRQAVAWVIRNRMEWRGQGPAAICLARLQFSCWNDDYEAQRIARLTAPDPAVWTNCWRAAVGAYFGILPDLSRAADHYLNPVLTRKIRPLHDLPEWYDANKVTTKLGRHEFLRLAP
jgi:hypothetical protein